MARVPLTGGAYEAKSLIASVQRCLNLYPEAMPPEEDEEAPFTHYTVPGTVLLASPPAAGAGRQAYTASNGDLYVVIGANVYYVSPRWSFIPVGKISAGSTPTSMSDNGATVGTLVLVDGSANGYAINLNVRSFTPISDVAFYGADRVDFVDTFFVFNRPATNQFYMSPSNWVPGVPFDTLDIAAKTGSPDPLASIIVIGRQLWLPGTLGTEVWYGAGAADFYFQAVPNILIHHGVAAKYSIAGQDSAAFWLSQDKEGRPIVVKASGYQASRVSTHAIENTIQSYSTYSDAIGFCYQQEGHAFYILTFPTANATWVYDQTTNLWHERAWIDGNGQENRHRANCSTFAYGKNIVLDWENGNLYALDLTVSTDNGAPMTFRRGFPHNMNDGRRVFYRQFIADMQVGFSTNTVTASPPLISLRWSDDRGASWSNPVLGSLGAAGQYLTSIQFNRLGMARDRVFELFWSSPGGPTALNGAFIDFKPAGT